MKKSFIFASFIAIVAMLAVSCQSKVPAPKARFACVPDGLTVTFQNASKDAESFAWDFGDKTDISNEKEPVHTYAQAGTYTVKLTAKNAGGEDIATENISVEPKAFKIDIDGVFEDWKAVPAESLAEASVDENAYGDAVLTNIKFCTNPDNIFFYTEFLAGTDADDIVEYLAIMMDMDDDPMTGYSIWFWKYDEETNAGTEFLILGGLSGGFENADILKFAEGAPQDAWDGNWEDTGATGAIAASQVVTLPNGHKALEGKIKRSAIPNSNPKALNIGVYVSNADWAEIGNLPQITVLDDGTNKVGPMLKVRLN